MNIQQDTRPRGSSAYQRFVIVDPQIALEPNHVHGRFAPRLHRSLQYRTSSHVFSHFLRQANESPHAGQVFVGRSAFFTPRITAWTPSGQRMMAWESIGPGLAAERQGPGETTIPR